jgi:hypothetical protein
MLQIESKDQQSDDSETELYASARGGLCTLSSS